MFNYIAIYWMMHESFYNRKELLYWTTYEYFHNRKELLYWMMHESLYNRKELLYWMMQELVYIVKRRAKEHQFIQIVQEMLNVDEKILLFVIRGILWTTDKPELGDWNTCLHQDLSLTGYMIPTFFMLKH